MSIKKSTGAAANPVFQKRCIVLRAQDETPKLDGVTPVAPYDRDPAIAALHCFDRDTGRAVPVRLLKTFAEALAQYRLHPESKFEHADFQDRGQTKRWHVFPTVIENISKEVNHWEEQLYLGEIPEIQINYGVDPYDRPQVEAFVRDFVKKGGNQTRLARRGVASRSSLNVLAAGGKLSPRVMTKIYRAIQVLEAEGYE